MNKNFIELNGKRYDAVTGALIGAVEAEPTPVKRVPVVTDFIKAPTSAKPAPRAHHAAQPKPALTKTQAPKTLMRRAVHKPKTEQKPVVKQHYPLAHKAQQGLLVQKKSAASVDPIREKRAQAIHKSPAVDRFAKPLAARPALTAPTPKVTVRVDQLAVHPAPSHHVQQTTATPLVQKQPTIFESALATATSHEQTFQKKSRKSGKRIWQHKLANATAGLMAVLVVGTFIAYMNRTALELEVASVKAGFQANMPGYAPADFTPAVAGSEKGKVTISFSSPSNGSNFTLTQESSKWGSQDLFDDIVAKNQVAYQTIQSGGKTIYLYDNDKAAWVDGGILYRITGASLEGNQLISLASSL